MLDPESWRDIPDFPGFQASTHGRLRDPDHRILIPRIGTHGYPQVYIKARRRATWLVHRLILMTFAGPPPRGHQGCHDDGNRLNSRPDNLRWGTPTDNFLDRIRHGTNKLIPRYRPGISHNVGEAHGRAKFTDDLVRQIRASRESGVVWAARLGVSKTAISLIRRGKRWAHVT